MRVRPLRRLRTPACSLSSGVTTSKPLLRHNDSIRGNPVLRELAVKARKSAILLIDCPDRKGLVAAIAEFLYTHGANILHADQHQDNEQGLFFMRVEWSLDD